MLLKAKKPAKENQQPLNEDGSRGAQAKMRRVGEALSRICIIAQWAFFVIGVLSLVGAGISLVTPEWIDLFKGIIKQNTLYQLLTTLADLSSMGEQYVAAIGCTLTAVSFLVLSVFVRNFRKLLLAFIETEKPFTSEIAAVIRKKAYALLLTLFYNPVVAIVLFLIATLFSYLVDYGAYIQEQADQKNRIQGEMIISFAEITENKSGQTGQHIRRVSEYAKILALEMGMNEKQADDLRLASTMHDIGKLLIPSEILEKPGKLTEEEYTVMKQHTVYGGQLLENVEGEVMKLARTVALEHHERADGRGYPAGKTDISLEGRIVAVADVYDALTSKRSYKEAWTEDRAYAEIVKGSGTQFDAQVVEAFKRGYGPICRIREAFRD